MSPAECPPSAAICVDTWTNINQTSNLTKYMYKVEINAAKMNNNQMQIEWLLSAATSKDIWIVNQTCNPTKQAPATSKPTSKPHTNAKTGSKMRIATKTIQRKLGIKGRQVH